MDESGIWAMVIIVAIVIMAVTFLTSVTVLHKKFVEKPIEKMEDKSIEEVANRESAIKNNTENQNSKEDN